MIRKPAMILAAALILWACDDRPKPVVPPDSAQMAEPAPAAPDDGR